MNNNIYQRDIKVSFKSCSSEDRKNFPTASCILPISIGQKVHEGAKFAATLKLIERSFHRCTILLDDSIQKYTLKITSNEDLEILHHKSIAAGTEWLDRQKIMLESLSIKCDIMRWDDWVNKSLFVKMYEQVLSLYYKNVEYKNAFDSTARTFLSRFLQSHSSIDYETAYQLCLRYLWEECSVMMLWAENKYDFEIYPSGRNEAMSATYKMLINDLYPGVLKSVGLHFKKKKIQEGIEVI